MARQPSDAQLCAHVREGCCIAKEAILSRYEPLISSLLRTLHTGPGIDHEDMRQEARIRVLRSAAKWNRRRGVKFITYVTWAVRNGLLTELGRQERQLRPIAENAETVPQPDSHIPDLAPLLASLPALEAAVLRLSFGLDGTPFGRNGRRAALSLTAIGLQLGVTREGVQAALARGLALARELHQED